MESGHGFQFVFPGNRRVSVRQTNSIIWWERLHDHVHVSCSQPATFQFSNSVGPGFVGTVDDLAIKERGDFVQLEVSIIRLNQFTYLAFYEILRIGILVCPSNWLICACTVPRFSTST